jgi:hypothetical protein
MQRDDKQAAAGVVNISAHTGSKDTEDSSSSNGVTVEDLVQQLSEETDDMDMYALTVKTIMNGVRGVKLAHMLLGLLFTVALQLGMMCLLWYVVLTPAADGPLSETDKLWTQVGQLQGQLCWMQSGLKQNNIDINKNNTAAAAAADCAGAWPQVLRARPVDVDADPEKAVKEYVKAAPSWCPGWKTGYPLSWENASQCLTHTYGQKGEDNPQGCETMVKQMSGSLAAFGRGLLYPRVNKSQSCDGTSFSWWSWQEVGKWWVGSGQQVPGQEFKCPWREERCRPRCHMLGVLHLCQARRSLI